MSAIAAGFVPYRGILTGGFPCQDLSVAGRCAGLGGARSGLFWHIMRLADELRPQWLVLENVPGLLSAVCSCPGDGTCTGNGRAVRCGEHRTVSGGSEAHERRRWFSHVPHGVKGGACPAGCMEQHGGAMGVVLGALAERGYGFAYRVLDAQFFGVPQRRNRVFIVGCLGDWAAPAEILLESESSTRDSAPGGSAGADVAGTLGSRAGGSRTTDLDGHGAYITGTVERNDSGDVGADSGSDPSAVAYTVHGANSNVRERHAFPAEVARCLDTGGGFMPNQGGTVVASTLQGGGRRGHRVDAEGAAGGHLVPFDAVQITSGENRSNPQPGDPAPTLSDTSRVHVAAETAYTLTSHHGRNDREQTWVTHALTSEGSDASEDGTGRGTPIVAVPVALRGRDDGSAIETGEPGDPAFSVRTPGGGSSYPMVATDTPMAFNWRSAGDMRLGYGDKPTALHSAQAPAVQNAMAVRRLTPRECERLQGFPDDWTRWLADGTEQSDSARYRQLGNAVAVPVVRWIARRLVAADRDVAADAGLAIAEVL